jgi:hypothetical protein
MTIAALSLQKITLKNHRDFLYDSELYSGDTTGAGWSSSEVWSEKWFGPMPFTEDGDEKTATISNTDKRLSGR